MLTASVCRVVLFIRLSGLREHWLVGIITEKIVTVYRNRELIHNSWEHKQWQDQCINLYKMEKWESNSAELYVQFTFVCFKHVDECMFWGNIKLHKHEVPNNLSAIHICAAGTENSFLFLTRVVVGFYAVVSCFPVCTTGNPCGFLQLINITIYCTCFLHELCWGK